MNFVTSLYTVLLMYGIYVQVQTICDPSFDNKKDIKSKPIISKNKKMLEMVERKFLDFMGISEKPNQKLRQSIKVPDHLWKLYYKWSDENYEDYDKNNADTARVIYHDGKTSLFF